MVEDIAMIKEQANAKRRREIEEEEKRKRNKRKWNLFNRRNETKGEGRGK